MNNELLDALTILEKEKNISKETLLEAIENSLLTACKNHFGKADNVKVVIDPDTCEYHCYQEKTVVETVEDPIEQISLQNAQMINGKYTLGDIVQVEVKSKEFGRIATQNAKNVILQKIREEERKVIYDEYFSMEKEVVTGVVQRYVGRNVSINLGKADALLTESEQIKGETFQPTERIKVYILEVKATSKGPKILVSRTHPELVKRLFESEVSEVRDGIVEIKAISREAGSRTKIAVWSNDPDVDPVGACVGLNGARVNAIVNELRGEKIDPEGKILLPEDTPGAEESEDALLKYYDADRSKVSKLPPAFKIKGTPYEPYGNNVLQGVVSVSALKAAAKRSDATITEYLTALLILAIYREAVREELDDEPIVISVPVNLRSLFPSKTVRNFFCILIRENSSSFLSDFIIENLS